MTNFGVFVDIGGIEGLLHISDISWGKINHPSEIFKNSQEIEVMILDFNEKDDRISLGYKQLTDDPWMSINERYMEGQKAIGKVVSLTDFGAFVELEPGIEGLIHISDLTWSRKMIHPKKVLSVGQEVLVIILALNSESKRISLGLKQSSPHPLEEFRQKHSPGSRVKGKITSLTGFGAFLEVEQGIEGLIHISDISWKKIKHPSDILKIGDETEVIILTIDVNKQKLSLGIKQLEGDIWEDFFKRQQIGDLVNTKIIRIVDFGVFVEITPGIEGVVFLSELDENKIEKPADVFNFGDEKIAKIIKLNTKDKKISLSFKQAQLDEQKKEYKKYSSSQDGSLTLGDLMKDQLKKIETKPKKVIIENSKEDQKKKSIPEKKTKKEEIKDGKKDSKTTEKKEVEKDKEKKAPVKKDATTKKENKEKITKEKKAPVKKDVTTKKENKEKVTKEKKAPVKKDAKKKSEKKEKKEEKNDKS